MAILLFIQFIPLICLKDKFIVIYLLIVYYNKGQQFKYSLSESSFYFINSSKPFDMPSQSLLYDYKSTFNDFLKILEQNKERAMSKKQEYLQKIMSIFRQFVKKCEKQIDSIIQMKIQKLLKNYSKVSQYFGIHDDHLSNDDHSLMIAQFLIKPFERFPFSGNKNQKLFKQQYNLIQKASVLIEQTLIDSFNEDQIPTFDNEKFFKTLQNNGLGQQSLTKLRINPQNLNIEPICDIVPIQKNIKSVKIISRQLILLISDNRCVQFWDINKRKCIKKFYSQVMSQISCGLIFRSRTNYLTLGYCDQQPKIITYRMDQWKRYATNISHTKQITKLIQYNHKFIISGSNDGNICIHQFSHHKTVHQSPHISSIEDIILKNNFLYVLLKCSTVCQYEIRGVAANINGNLDEDQRENNRNNDNNQQIMLQFRRTLSAGYISLIRYPEVTSNFVGVACHIYGLSQIQITRKFKIEEHNIINIPEMIADFIILESKQTSQFFAICCFQNSTTIRIYSLLSQSLIYQIQNDYSGQVGVSGYMPKLQITCMNDKNDHNKMKYILLLVVQSQFPEDNNVIKLFQLKL